METVYVIGVNQCGGAYLWCEDFYATFEDAKKELDVLWKKDQDYADLNGQQVKHTTSIFTLYLKK